MTTYRCPHCGAEHRAEVWCQHCDNKHSIMSGIGAYICPTCNKPTSYINLIIQTA